MPGEGLWPLHMSILRTDPFIDQILRTMKEVRDATAKILDNTRFSSLNSAIAISL